MEHLCKSCRRVFDSPRHEAKYCSNACRQRAYRRQRVRVVSDRTTDPHEQAVATKRASKVRTRDCKFCGMKFECNQASRKKQFCDARCKMAYYRRYDYSGKYNKPHARLISPRWREKPAVPRSTAELIQEAFADALYTVENETGEQN